MEERVSELEELETRVQEVWEETKLLYEEELEISLLQKELEQADRWLSSYEDTLTADDYGVGPDHNEPGSETGDGLGLQVTKYIETSTVLLYNLKYFYFI